ncbi:hypothetical protein L6452_39019 [Arctium lappa]|uniref:Uncharacterized protein n=1 Tax=Arctium lappa TaxID=4217 RepID=A0ACB8XSV0_ARCLA|nr:hypothetical protein L6452_39019 [Arctium lappa]
MCVSRTAFPGMTTPRSVVSRVRRSHSYQLLRILGALNPGMPIPGSSNPSTSFPCNQRKVDLLKPNQSLPHIESLPLFKILEQPELGILDKRLKIDQNAPEMTIKCKERDLMVKVLKLVEDKTWERNMIRRFECKFGLRRRHIPPLET